MSNPTKTLNNVELPEDRFWEFEYESPTQVHWYRKNVTAEEVAEDTARSPREYKESISDEQMAYSMTLRYENGWSVDFTTPSVMKGMGDYDGRYSVKSVSLEEALDHVERMFAEKEPA